MPGVSRTTDFVPSHDEESAGEKAGGGSPARTASAELEQPQSGRGQSLRQKFVQVVLDHLPGRFIEIPAGQGEAVLGLSLLLQSLHMIEPGLVRYAVGGLLRGFDRLAEIANRGVPLAHLGKGIAAAEVRA